MCDVFFFNDTATTEIYTLSLHDALPISAHEQWAQVSGTKGCVSVPDFVLPYFGSESAFEVNNASFEISGCSFNMEPRIRRVNQLEYSNSHPTAQETNLFRNFAEQVGSGRLNDDWPEQARQTQAVMEACLASARSGEPSEPV